VQFEGEFWGKRLSSKSRGWGNKVEIQLGGNPGQSKCAEMSFDPLSHDFSTLSDRLYQPKVAKRLINFLNATQEQKFFCYLLFFFEIDCTIFYTNLHELFCQFIS
jgi:hypothetical protein